MKKESSTSHSGSSAKKKLPYDKLINWFLCLIDCLIMRCTLALLDSKSHNFVLVKILWRVLPPVIHFLFIAAFEMRSTVVVVVLSKDVVWYKCRQHLFVSMVYLFSYGSFFGPSQPVIAQRVIQESKSLLENQHLASRLSNPHQINKNKNKVSNGGSKSSVHIRPPKLSEVKVKAQKIKDTRDYSFLLSDDAEIPAPTKEPPPRNTSGRSSEARPAQVPGKSRQPSSNGSKHVYAGREDKKLVSVGSQLPSKSGSNNKLTSTSKPSLASADSRKQLGNNSGNGPGRPVGPKGLPSRTPVSSMGNKSLAPSIKTPVNAAQKPPLSKAHSSISRQSVEQRKDAREISKPKMIPKQSVASSTAQTKRPPTQNLTHRASQDQRPKKKPVRRPFDDDDDDGDRAISMIRRMFHYNPNKFADDDDDDIDMEAGFDDIMREERRSAKIAQQEDDEQLRLLEEEEERMRKRRLAKLKKQKLGIHSRIFAGIVDLEAIVITSLCDYCKSRIVEVSAASSIHFLLLSISVYENGKEMGTLISAGIGIPSLRRVPKPIKPITARPLRCLRNNGDDNRLHEQRFEGSCNVEMSQLSEDDQGVKHSDIWKLFREAQQNILYLNKQRLEAIEQLNKGNREKQSLLNRIEKLEEEKHAGAGKDKLSVFWELLLRIDSMVLTSMISPGEASKFRRNVFHVIHICTEMAPLVYGGSIASYVTGISCALQRKGHLVEVILPKYASLNLAEVQGLREVKAEAYSYFNGQLHGNRVWTGVVYGIGVTLIEPLQYSSFFSREMIYGYPDDFERQVKLFSYFSRASLDYIVKCGKQPDVLHIHNWETAIIGPLFWDLFVKQGIEQPDKLALCGLDPARLHRPDRLQDSTSTHLVNVLKGGIVYSNSVVIMSSIHSKHRILHSLNHGLESTLSVHRDKLVIAPYGLDKLTWDPSTDCFLPENFNAESMEGKAICKVEVQQRLGLLKDASIILVGCIFSERGNIDMKKLKEVVWNTQQSNVQVATSTGLVLLATQVVFMGIGERSISNQALESFQKELKEDPKFVFTYYDEALFHLIFAGSDIILCHSYDPADEVPLKALRYGAAPIVVGHDASTARNFINRDHETTKYSQFINSTFGNISLSLAIDEIVGKMADNSLRKSASCPSWFTPKRLLIIFCVVNLINYVDRGAIASNGVNGSLETCTDSGICTSGSGIQGDFNLSNFQDGILSSAFMVGLLIASPIFASLAKR
ncbi:putative starch synthase 4, chloroplastic/amyloplastic isoform X1 [Senna tora]|uniref:starch synthase n=1 Tax=Senna tora TaxID=362788 RepID=A0A834TVT8_9FABA|nr:putative starch synthase 4, chloroplastic/amyloplastic isoform X1 [Senna tora]